MDLAKVASAKAASESTGEETINIRKLLQPAAGLLGGLDDGAQAAIEALQLQLQTKMAQRLSAMEAAAKASEAMASQAVATAAEAAAPTTTDAHMDADLASLFCTTTKNSSKPQRSTTP